MIVYFNGQFMPKSEVAISPDDRGFIFADGVYEVIRSYRGRLFKCDEHLERLAHALRELRIEGLEVRCLKDVGQRLIADNNLEMGDALVYIQVTRGAAPRSHEFPPAGTPPTVFVQAKTYLPRVEEQQNGASAILVPDQRWSRCDIKTIGLLASVLARQRAREAGAFEAIFAQDGLLQEGTHSSILFVQKDVLICPPLTNRILPSVTRSVVMELALAESIEVEVRPCREGELFKFGEVIMLGTGVEIVPITAINGQKVRHGYVGPITRRLQSAFKRASLEAQLNSRVSSGLH
jgi:D-alanine transaminase